MSRGATMAEIKLQRGKISDFQGDAMVVPSDVDLTYERANDTVREVLGKGGSDLLKEVSAIGLCDIGHAVITKAYGELKVKNVIFMAYTGQENLENQADFVLLHQALRNVFDLAVLYKAQTIAIDIAPLRAGKENLLRRALSKVLDTEPPRKLTTDEMIDIVMSISEGYKKTLKEIVVFR